MSYERNIFLGIYKYNTIEIINFYLNFKEKIGIILESIFIAENPIEKYYTKFRQTFLLRQYSFIFEQYFKCSNTYAIFFLIAGKQNSWIFHQHCFYFGGEN